MSLKLPLLILALVISAGNVTGQTTGPLQWSKQHQRPVTSALGYGPPLEAYNDVKALSSGNTIAVGYTVGANPGVVENDALVRKINNSTGSIMNERFLDYYGGLKTDEAIKVLIAEPYIYVIGTATFGTAPNDKDMFIIKMDTSLNTIWSFSINTLGNPNDIAVDAGLDAFGNIYILGNTTRTTTGGDIILVKLDNNSTQLFKKYYSSTGNYYDEAKALAVEPNGVCNITGSYTSATLGSRLLGLKVWSNGAQLWAKYHDVTSGAVQPDEGVSVSYDPVNNDMYVCGRGRNASGNYDWVVVRFAGSDGTKIWSKKYAGTSNYDDAGAEIIYTTTGELFACGTIKTTVSGTDSPNIQLRKLNPVDGATIWNKVYNFLNGAFGPSEEKATTMLVSPSGTIYVGGTVYFPTPTYYQPYQLVLAYNSSGVQQWTHLESSGSTSGTQGIDVKGLAYSSSQNALYAAGYKYATISFLSYSTILKFGPTAIVSPLPDRIAENEEGFISPYLFPNPASNYIQLQRFDEGVAQLQIINASGKLIMWETVQEAMTQVDISTLPAGLYVVRYTCNQSTQTMRFVKE
ncbi:MAG: T9SS type A sorting domain-containing protein [Bacteroidetes bacterium]|nr:T9SS type A sorting domain-containing protein [Bacteroidota bacterium]